MAPAAAYAAEEPVQDSGGAGQTGTAAPSNAALLEEEGWHSIEDSELAWKFDEASGTLTIAGSGEMPYFNYLESPWQSKNEGIKTVVIDGDVTSIGQYAFCNCSQLTSVKFPNTLTSIASQAFWKCSALTSVELPASLVSIGDDAFRGCGLTSVKLPSGLTEIGQMVFAECKSLELVVFPDKLESISDFAFQACTSLVSVKLPSGLTSIGYGTFDQCASLESVNFPDGMESIGTYAFRGCDLASVDLPSGLTEIGDGAFTQCAKLKTVTFHGEQAPVLGEDVFGECTALESIRVPEGAEGYEEDDWSDLGSKIGYFDGTAPTLQTVDAIRTSAKEAVVTFTSNEEGSYYYAVVESGADKPDIDTSEIGALCKANENTVISLSDFENEDAKDIYIVVKDAAGNVSDPLSIEIPKYVALKSVTVPAPITGVANGTEKTAEALGLPKTVGITTTEGDSTASVTWNVAGCSYNPDSTAEQTFPVTGEITLPEGVTNPDSVSLEVTVSVTVSAKASGSGGGGSSRPSYPPVVEAAEHGHTAVSPRRPERGDTVTITLEPDEGYVVKEVRVTDRNGEPVEVKRDGNNVWTFLQPSGKVTITVDFQPVEPDPWVNPFSDVDEGAWYADAVAYVCEKGLMAGTSADTFSPDGITTRGQIVTILWRLVDSPAGEAPVDFADVDPAAWYGEAVRWAAGQGIVGGYGNGSFGPNDPVTREQLAAILYRFAQHMGYDTEGQADLSGFTDLTQVSTYAREAMAWCVDAGLLSGTSPTTLSPRGQATRAQTAAVLMRLCQGYGM